MNNPGASVGFFAPYHGSAGENNACDHCK